MAIALQIPPFDPKKLARGILIIVLVVIIFCIGKTCGSKKEEIQVIGTNKNQRAIDSLIYLKSKDKDSIRFAYRKIDSLSAKKDTNNKKVKNGITAIKNFTPNSRQRFHDSLMRSNGFR